MSGTDEVVLGLFPLGLVLLPGEVVPLHIFEERYKLLVRERLDGGEFGVVFVEDRTLREYGCTASVVEVLEEFEDGRLNVLIEGGRRFRLLELRPPGDPDSEYLSGLIGYHDDREPDVPEELRAGTLEVYHEMLHLMDVEPPRETGEGGPLSFRLATAFDFGAPLKQELLESLSEAQRLETLRRVIEALLPQLRLRKDREEAIRGNGKGY